uniref:Uncharacterized protein n=1 Tax=Aegilops tauschii subsp. strangulata TaxID=200361 RepID=A0A452ZW53_AEGTS
MSTTMTRRTRKRACRMLSLCLMQTAIEGDHDSGGGGDDDNAGAGSGDDLFDGDDYYGDDIAGGFDDGYDPGDAGDGGDDWW